MITGIDFVALPVTDMARARAFYQDTLGLTPGALSNEDYVEFALGDGPAIGLDAAPLSGSTAPVATGSVAIAFHDLAPVVETLKAQGRLPQDPYGGPSCDAGFAVDSEGNSLVVHRRKDEPTRDRVLDFVMLPVERMARARAFYEGTLGLAPETVSGESWVEYVLADGSVLALGDVSGLGLTFAPVVNGTVGLNAPDLEAAFARLKALGFAVADAVLETPVCHLGHVRDSEGNTLALHRAK